MYSNICRLVDRKIKYLYNNEATILYQVWLLRNPFDQKKKNVQLHFS